MHLTRAFLVHTSAWLTIQIFKTREIE